MAQQGRKKSGDVNPPSAVSKEEPFDYAMVKTIARIAIYDDFLSAPRVVSIEPADTGQFIENISSRTYELASSCGGSIPYTVIREVAENFIHAQFQNIIVSIFDKGNTIRFADQGPGIENKRKALEPGFTSAIEPMKKYIRGVGSGLPIVREWLSLSNGTISIDDNLTSGAVITISLSKDGYLKQHPIEEAQESKQMFVNSEQTSVSLAAPVAGGHTFENESNSAQPSSSQEKNHLGKAHPPYPYLSEKEKELLSLLAQEHSLRLTDVVELCNIPSSTAFKRMKKLEEAGLIETAYGKRKQPTDWGYQVAQYYSQTS